MSRLGRYWIAFVIVAVGLALSWGQVGRKTERVLQDQAVIYLLPEAVCQPGIRPCAAIAADRALVLGPDRQGFRVKQTGLEAADIVRLEAFFVTADGRNLAARVRTVGMDTWLLSGTPAQAVEVRLQIVGNHETTVAEFPL